MSGTFKKLLMMLAAIIPLLGTPIMKSMSLGIFQMFFLIVSDKSFSVMYFIPHLSQLV